MSKSLPTVNVASNDSLQSLWTKINNVITLANTETVTANSTGATTIGNGFIIGQFGANTLYTNEIFGGNNSISGNLLIGSNTTFSSNNISINTNTFNIISNSTVNGTITLNGNLDIGSSYSLIVGAVVINSNGYQGSVNSSLFSNNTTYFNGQNSSYYANVTSPSFATNISVGNTIINTSTIVVEAAQIAELTVSDQTNLVNITVSGNTLLNGNSVLSNLLVTGNAYVNGNIQIAGNLIYTGVSSNNLIPVSNGQTLGNTSLRWSYIYVNDGNYSNSIIIANTLSVNNSVTLGNTLTVNGSIYTQSNLSVNNSITCNVISSTHGLNVGVASVISGSLQTSGTNAQLLDTFSNSYIRSVEYMFEITDNLTTSYHTTKVLGLQDGSNTWVTEYAGIYSNVSLATFSANISSGGSFQLWVNPVSTNSTVKFIRYGVQT